MSARLKRWINGAVGAAGIVSARNDELPDDAGTRFILIAAGVVGASLGASALASGDV